MLAGFNSGSIGPGCGRLRLHACSKYSLFMLFQCASRMGEISFVFFENIILIYECTRRDNKNKEKIGRQQAMRRVEENGSAMMKKGCGVQIN